MIATKYQEGLRPVVEGAATATATLCRVAMMNQKFASQFPLISSVLLSQAGILPIQKGPIRFAVGPPDGITSNAWKLWTSKNKDVYITCRDNFKEAKVSLHASGRWRMGFTSEALTKSAELILPQQNRAWEVWDRPPPQLPNATIAFRLVFPTPELAVRPEQRSADQWRKVVYIEAAPPGKLTVLTVFITDGDGTPAHETEPSFCVASLPIDSRMRVQLVAHGEPEGDMPATIEKAIAEIRNKVIASGQELPPNAYAYILGRLGDGSRYLVGARAARQDASPIRAAP